jgi:geranylgeranyl diphosphate synthase type II
MIFTEEMKKRTEEADVCVRSYLPEIKGHAKMLAESMDYSVGAGGKRLRPVMMKAAFDMCGGQGDIVKPFMAAIEFIHNYSLVHDDLPEMDNDMLRRGVPSTHAKYGSGMAVLAGDGLLNLAFETALRAFDVPEVRKDRVIKALKILSEKSGLYGMLGGQACDVDAEEKKRDVDLDELMYIHENKTGALIEAAMKIGAVLAGASKEETEKISRVALLVGTAFQIEDDILDVVGDEKVIGKRVGSDIKNNKITYVTIKGVEEAKKDAKEMSEKAIELFDSIGRENDFLRELILSMIGRTK